jgi:hypothetical protein
MSESNWQPRSGTT